MKVKEVRHIPAAGGRAYAMQTRVRKLDKDEAPPVDAETVLDNTQEHDWQEEGE
jgi:hypothetical protein